MSCRYLHATKPESLPSIAERGLLTKEELVKLGLKIRYEWCTRAGSVYLTDTESGNKYGAFDLWEDDSLGYTQLLCVDPVSDVELIEDRNFTDPNSSYREHRAPVPPTNIRVHGKDGVCVPITQYVTDVAPSKVRNYAQQFAEVRSQ